MNRKERSNLIEQLIEGDISEGDFLRIEADLTVDPDARAEYFERLSLSDALSAEANADAASLPARSFPTVAWRWILASAAAVALVSLVTVLLRSSDDSRPSLVDSLPEAEEVAEGFALVTGQVDAEWGGERFLSNGSLVPGGELALKSWRGADRIFQRCDRCPSSSGGI